MSFHGGFLGVCAAIALFARQQKIDILKLGDLVAPVAPIGLFFGRCANFINGELWGRQSPTIRSAWCSATTPSEPPTAACPAGDPRHPSQLYEAALEGVLLFLILNFAVYRLKWLQRRGALVATFLICYGLFRAVAGERAQSRPRHAQLPAGPDHGDDPVDRRCSWSALAAVARCAKFPLSRTSRKTMSLLDRLRAQIAQDGPISVAEYFTRCLHDPRDGYYATRPSARGR
jgi:hypothetical protein